MTRSKMPLASRRGEDPAIRVESCDAVAGSVSTSLPARRFRVASSSSFWMWSLTVGAVVFLSCYGIATAGEAEANSDDRQPPKLLPGEIRLELPNNASPIAGGGRRIVLPEAAALQGDSDTQPVGRIYLEVGDRYVVLLPDGRLQSIAKQGTDITERPFTPLDKRNLGFELTTKRFQGFDVRSTRRYLYVSNTSRSFSNATSRILETMYPAVVNYCRRQGLEVSEPEFPLVVIMFRTQKEYQEFHRVADDVIAYYNPITNWIVLFEQSKLTEVAPELAFKQAVSTVAHEGVHQILNNIGVQQRLSQWPLWFNEGLAEYFAPTEMSRRVRWKGVGLVNDLRMHELSEFYQRNKDDLGDGKLLQRLTHSAQLNSLDYAASWALIHYLARVHREDFRNCFREVAKLRPLEVRPLGALYSKHFPTDFANVESQLIRYLQSLPYDNPILNQTHFVVIVKDRAKPYVTSSPKRLREIKKKIGSKSFQIRAFPNLQAATQFANSWEARQ